MTFFDLPTLVKAFIALIVLGCIAGIYTAFGWILGAVSTVTLACFVLEAKRKREREWEDDWRAKYEKAKYN